MYKAQLKLYPSCYFVRSDMFVLEDLSTKGFRHLKSNETFNMSHHRLVLRQLAHLHSASLAWEIKENINIGKEFENVLFETQLLMKNAWYETGMKVRLTIKLNFLIICSFLL